MNAAVDSAGQVPDQPSICVPEKQFSAFGFLSCAGYVVQNPANFCAGEIWVNQKAGDVFYLAFTFFVLTPAGFFEPLRTKILSPCALPDYSVVDGFSCGFLPDYCGFALIGDSDCGDLVRCSVDCGQCSAYNVLSPAPDLHSVVFDPAGMREYLFMLHLVGSRRPAVLREQHTARAGSSLIDSGYIFLCHRGFYLLVNLCGRSCRCCRCGCWCWSWSCRSWCA